MITWNDSLSVNIKEIDEQHKQLVEMVNALHEAMRVGKGRDVLWDIFSQLANYTNTHFAHEEKLLRQHQYPGLTAHLREHQELARQVVDLQAQASAGQIGLSVTTMNFLKDWLVNHIQGVDKRYSAYLNARGVR